MKKTIFLFATVLMLSLGFAQEGVTPGSDRAPLTQGQIPSLVTERFNKEYPGISGNWSQDGDNFKVEFVDPQSHLGHIIIYDRNGDVVRRESELDKPVPDALNSYYQKNFPGETIRTWSVTDKDGIQSYYTKRDKEVLFFDNNGKPMTNTAKKTGRGQR